MANTKITTSVIADGAITSAKLDTDISVSGSITGTLATAAQPNITSVGTLTGFTSTGIDDNASSTTITIDSSNRVNIGKASSVSGKPLEVQANTSGQSLGIYGRSSDGFSFLGFYANGANTEYASLRADNTSSLNIRTNGTNAITIDSSQNVGIGTTSPDAPLHTLVSSGAAFNLFEGSSGKWVFGQTSGGSCQVGGLFGSHSGLVVDTSGKVGIGTDTPGARLHVVASGADGIALGQDTGSTNNSSRLFFNSIYGNWAVFNNSGLLNFQSGAAAGSTSGNYTDFQLTTSQVICRRPFTVLDNNLNISSGYGINFSDNANAAGMSSEVLDDYEEGTFTVGFTGASISALNTTGHYTKIGRVVYYSYYSSAATISNASGVAELTGLPFTVKNGVTYYQPFYTAHNTFFGNSTSIGVEGYPNVNATSLRFIQRGTSNNVTFVNGVTKYLMVAGFYITDA